MQKVKEGAIFTWINTRSIAGKYDKHIAEANNSVVRLDIRGWERKDRIHMQESTSYDADLMNI